MRAFHSFIIPLCLLISTNTFALHANKRANRLAQGDKASQSIVKLIIGGASCTGSFLSKRSILTAAHCVPGWETGDNLTIITYDGSNPKQAYAVSWENAQMEYHPSYNYLVAANDLSQVKSDLAVITLKNEVPDARAVYLYDDLGQDKDFLEYAESLVGSSVYLAGNGSRQRLFRRGLLATYDFIKSLTKQTTATLTEATEGTLQFETKRGTKVCQGDSGGPAFLRSKNGDMIQLGVVSIGYTGNLWAKNCGRTVLYASVGGDNLEWINETQAKLESR